MKMLRARRKEMGLTMKQLGSIVGVSEAAISQYETGKRQADFEVLLKLGDALHCPVDYLLRGDSDEKAPTPGTERPISDEDIMFALWGDTSEVDKDDLEDVKRYAAFVRERKKKT